MTPTTTAGMADAHTRDLSTIQALREQVAALTDERDRLRGRLGRLAADWEGAEVEDIYDEAENAEAGTWQLAGALVRAALSEEPTR